MVGTPSAVQQQIVSDSTVSTAQSSASDPSRLMQFNNPRRKDHETREPEETKKAKKMDFSKMSRISSSSSEDDSSSLTEPPASKKEGPKISSSSSSSSVDEQEESKQHKEGSEKLSKKKKSSEGSEPQQKSVHSSQTTMNSQKPILQLKSFSKSSAVVNL